MVNLIRSHVSIPIDRVTTPSRGHLEPSTYYYE